MQDADEAISNTQVPAQSENDTDKVTVAVEIELNRVSLVDATPEGVQVQSGEKTEPEGYQMCDMETGMCYWVPANKAQPATADQQEKRDEAPLNSSTAADTLDTPVASEEPKEDPVTLETKAPTPTPALTSSLAPALVPGASSRSRSPSPSPRLSPFSTTQDSETSPGRVGKLSRNRLAMFEKST